MDAVSRKLLTNSPSIIPEPRFVSSISVKVINKDRKLWSTIIQRLVRGVFFKILIFISTLIICMAAIEQLQQFFIDTSIEKILGVSLPRFFVEDRRITGRSSLSRFKPLKFTGQWIEVPPVLYSYLKDFGLKKTHQIMATDQILTAHFFPCLYP